MSKLTRVLEAKKPNPVKKKLKSIKVTAPVPVQGFVRKVSGVAINVDPFIRVGERRLQQLFKKDTLAKLEAELKTGKQEFNVDPADVQHSGKLIKPLTSQNNVNNVFAQVMKSTGVIGGVSHELQKTLKGEIQDYISKLSDTGLEFKLDKDADSKGSIGLPKKFNDIAKIAAQHQKLAKADPNYDGAQKFVEHMEKIISSPMDTLFEDGQKIKTLLTDGDKKLSKSGKELLSFIKNSVDGSTNGMKDLYEGLSNGNIVALTLKTKIKPKNELVSDVKQDAAPDVKNVDKTTEPTPEEFSEKIKKMHQEKLENIKKEPDKNEASNVKNNKNTLGEIAYTTSSGIEVPETIAKYLKALKDNNIDIEGSTAFIDLSDSLNIPMSDMVDNFKKFMKSLGGSYDEATLTKLKSSLKTFISNTDSKSYKSKKGINVPSHIGEYVKAIKSNSMDSLSKSLGVKKEDAEIELMKYGAKLGLKGDILTKLKQMIKDGELDNPADELKHESQKTADDSTEMPIESDYSKFLDKFPEQVKPLAELVISSSKLGSNGMSHFGAMGFVLKNAQSMPESVKNNKLQELASMEYFKDGSNANKELVSFLQSIGSASTAGDMKFDTLYKNIFNSYKSAGSPIKGDEPYKIYPKQKQDKLPDPPKEIKVDSTQKLEQSTGLEYHNDTSGKIKTPTSENFIKFVKDIQKLANSGSSINEIKAVMDNGWNSYGKDEHGDQVPTLIYNKLGVNDGMSYTSSFIQKMYNGEYDVKYPNSPQKSVETPIIKPVIKSKNVEPIGIFNVEKGVAGFPQDLTNLTDVKTNYNDVLNDVLVKDKDGKQFLKQTGNSATTKRALYDSAVVEAVYEFLGIDSVKSRMYNGADGSFVKLTEVTDGVAMNKYDGSDTDVVRSKIREGFVVDALLSNTDVVNDDGSNITINSDGIPTRGISKTALKSNSSDVTELWGMRTSTNRFKNNTTDDIQSQKVFGDMSYKDVMSQVETVLDKSSNLIKYLKSGDSSGDVTIDSIEQRLKSLGEYHNLYKQMDVESYKTNYIDEMTEAYAHIGAAGIFDKVSPELTNTYGTTLYDASGTEWDSIRGSYGASSKFWDYFKKTNPKATEMGANYLNSNAHSSQSSTSNVLKHEFLKSATDRPYEDYWFNKEEMVDGKLLPGTAKEVMTKNYNNYLKEQNATEDDTRLGLQMVHAFTQKLFNTVKLPNVNMESGTTQLVRNESGVSFNLRYNNGDGTYGKHGSEVKAGEHTGGMRRASLASYSLVQPCQSDNITIQNVPNVNIIGTYIMSSAGSPNHSACAGDSENEMIASHSNRPFRLDADINPSAHAVTAGGY